MTVALLAVPSINVVDPFYPGKATTSLSYYSIPNGDLGDEAENSPARSGILSQSNVLLAHQGTNGTLTQSCELIFYKNSIMWLLHICSDGGECTPSASTRNAPGLNVTYVTCKTRPSRQERRCFIEALFMGNHTTLLLPLHFSRASSSESAVATAHHKRTIGAKRIFTQTLAKDKRYSVGEECQFEPVVKLVRCRGVPHPVDGLI